MICPATVDINSASKLVDELQESDGQCSDASKLSAQERIFCDVFVANGGKAGEAARAAGYADASADVTACKLLCRKRVADRIEHLCKQFVHTQLPVAIQTLVLAAGDEKALWKDRIKAATSLLERGGMAAPKGGVNVSVGVAVDGQKAQAIIASVHEARSARMSVIPTAMSDNLRTIEGAVERLEDDAAGGDQTQGPAGAGVALPPPSSEQPPISDVSRPGPDALDAWKLHTKDANDGD